MNPQELLHKNALIAPYNHATLELDGTTDNIRYNLIILQIRKEHI